jgi:hypothetical protein
MGHGVGGARPVLHFRNLDFVEKKEKQKQKQKLSLFVTQM